MGMELHRYRPARAQAALQNNDAMLAICDGAANEEEKPHEVPEDKRCSDAAGGAGGDIDELPESFRSRANKRPVKFWLASLGLGSLIPDDVRVGAIIAVDHIHKLFIADFNEGIGNVVQCFTISSEPSQTELSVGRCAWVAPATYNGIPQLLRLDCKGPTEVHMSVPLQPSKAIYELAKGWQRLRAMDNQDPEEHIHIFDLQWTSSKRAIATFKRTSSVTINLRPKPSKPSKKRPPSKMPKAQRPPAKKFAQGAGAQPAPQPQRDSSGDESGDGGGDQGEARGVLGVLEQLGRCDLDCDEGADDGLDEAEREEQLDSHDADVDERLKNSDKHQEQAEQAAPPVADPPAPRRERRAPPAKPGAPISWSGPFAHLHCTVAPDCDALETSTELPTLPDLTF